MPGGVVRELVTLWGFDIDKQPLRELDAGLNTIKRTIRGVGIAAAGTAAAIGFVLNEAGKQEQTNVAFETIIGDAEEAEEAIRDLYEFAAQTPFTIPGIEASAKQLIAMGIETSNVIPTLKALGDVSAGLSVPLERIALNYGQIRAQGKLTGRELRDFAIAGVPLLAELAKHFGKTEEEVTAMVSAGTVGFKDVEKAFVNMTSKGGKFEDLMIKQSKTLHGLISNVQDYGIIFSRELGQEILPMAKEVVTTFIDWVKANRQVIKSNMVEFLQTLVGLFKDIVGFVTTFKDALSGLVGLFGGWNKVLRTTGKIFMGIMSLGMITGIGLVTKALWGMFLGWKAVGIAALWANVKMALIPLTIGAIVTAIALIAEDLLAFSQGRDSVFGRLVKFMDEAFVRIGEKFGILKDVAEFIVALILTPVRAIVNVFKILGDAFDVIIGKISILQGLGNIANRILNTLGVGNVLGSFSNMLGLNQGIDAASNQIAQGNTPSVALGSAPLGQDGNSNKNVSVQAQNEINLNVTGMNPDDAKDLVTSTLKDELGGVLRDTVRDGESQIER